MNAVVMFWVTAAGYRDSERARRPLETGISFRRNPLQDDGDSSELSYVPDAIGYADSGGSSSSLERASPGTVKRDSFKKFLEDSYEQMHGAGRQTSVGIVTEPAPSYAFGRSGWVSWHREPGRISRAVGHMCSIPAHVQSAFETPRSPPVSACLCRGSEANCAQNGIVVTVDIERVVDGGGTE